MDKVIDNDKIKKKNGNNKERKTQRKNGVAQWWEVIRIAIN